MKFKIYTDGSCKVNPGGRGGWAAIVIDENGTETELSGYDVNTTNNRMEMTAAITALDSLYGKHIVELVSDSQYLVKGASEWMRGWKAKSWAGVANVDLWCAIDRLCSVHDVTWSWVRGHSGDYYNERCDVLADKAATYVSDAMSSSYCLDVVAARMWMEDALADISDVLHPGTVIVKEESPGLAAKYIADKLVPYIEKNLIKRNEDG